MRYLIFSIIISFTLNIFADGYDPTHDLTFAFGSKCKGKGPINSTATSEGAGLKNIIESVRDDNSCKALTGALSDIEGLNINQLLKDKVAEQDVEYLAAQANDLELALQAEQKNPSPDADYITALKTELINTKISMAKSQKLANRERTRRRLETVGNFQKYSQSLFSKLKQSDQCLTKNPNLAAQIGAQILGLASTASSGLVGSLMLATATMVDSLVSFIRERSLGSKIKNIVNQRLGEALGCSFEGLAYTYCQARDVETIIQLNKNKDHSKLPQNHWLNGIGIMGQDVQSYMDWINQVDAGSPAGTAGRASDKKSAFSIQNNLRSIKIDLEGALNTAKDTVLKSSNKVEATKKALNDIAGKLQTCFNGGPGTSGCTVPEPFSTMFTTDPVCGPFVFLYSKGAERVKKGDANISCTTYVANQYPSPPDINIEAGNLIDQIISEGTQSVNIQLSQVSESNPDLVLAKVDAKSQNRRSAREFLNSAYSYLENILSEPNGIARKRSQKELIEKTKKQISNSLDILDKTDVSRTDSNQKISALSKELMPLGDTFAIPKALAEIINQDIDLKTSSGQIDENLAVVMQLSSSDSLGELIKYYIGLESAKTQARSAKELTKTNITSLASVFSENIENYLKKMSHEAKEDPDSKETLALFCMQLLTISDASQIENLNISQYCANQKYISVYEKSGLKMDYDELVKKPYPTRVCSVYDFYRKSYLYGLKSDRGLQGPSSIKDSTKSTH